jgi:hypothetical protein
MINRKYNTTTNQNQYREPHRYSIQRAINAGKHIPDEVMADYPQLKESSVFASLLDEATKAVGNSRKIKAALSKAETPAEQPAPAKGLPFGNSRVHREKLKKQTAPEETPTTDPAERSDTDPLPVDPVDLSQAETPEADPSNPESELAPEEADTIGDGEQEPDQDVATAEQEAADEIADEVEEQEVKDDEHEHARIMFIDRRHLNKDLAELCAKETDTFPINRIREILSQCGLILVDDEGNDMEVVLTGADGNTDIALAYNNGQRISNSALVLYWSRNDSSNSLNVNAYLS